MNNQSQTQRSYWHQSLTFFSGIYLQLRLNLSKNRVIYPSPLCQADKKKKLKVTEIQGDWKLRARLANLGIFKGVPVELLHATRCGQIMLQIRGSRIALDRETSHCIVVEKW